MRTAMIATAALLALAGCNKSIDNGYAVDVTVDVDQSVTLQVLEGIVTLDVDVQGAETFHTQFAVDNQLAGREAKFIYRPVVQSGTLSFAIQGLDQSGAPQAYGQGTTALKAGKTVQLTIVLTSNVPCPTPCPMLGATQCSGTQVQTCSMVNGCQQWSAPIDCGADMLCCSDACIAADVSNCYACGAACSGSTPACLATPMKCGCNVAVCAAGGMGCDTTTGSCVACTALPANSTDFYVDGTSFSGATGTAPCPFTTITAALTAANASTAMNKVIHIAPGTYSVATGEIFPLTVRQGTSLVGAGADKTIIKGTNMVNHSAAGGPFNGSYQVTILTGDTTGTSTISGVTLASPQATPTASYLGVFCDQGNAANTIGAPPPAMLPTPTTVLDGVTIGPNYDLGIVAATTTTPAGLGGCNIKIVRSTITGNNTGMWALGCGQGAGPSISVAVALGDGSAAGGNTFTKLTNAGSGIGFLSWDCVSPVSLDNNTFDDVDNAVILTSHSGPAGGDTSLPEPQLFDVRNNTFKNITVVGLDADRGAVLDQLTGNTFTAITSGASGTTNAVALKLTQPSTGTGNAQVVKARNNSFVGNDIAVEADGNAFVATTRPSFDWGTAADPGNNTFACNSAGHTGGTGFDVFFNVAAGSTVTIPMQGNKWDHVAPTSSATAANGLDIMMTNAVTVDTTGAAAANVTCPSPRVP